MKKKLFLFLLISISFLNSYGQTKMIVGKKHLLFVSIPNSWLQSPNEEIPFLIKPEAKNVSDRTYMYVLGLDYESSPDLNAWIEGNNTGLKNNIPDISIQNLDLTFDNLKPNNFLTGKYKIVTYTYPNGRKEALLVIESKTSIFTVVLSAKDSAEFNTYLNSFKELTNSLEIKAATVR
ncbi:hypothetical protein [Flavobacterium hungaricum]|uniref:PsbP C-terminal domain-containing protein n=1 Tax=Flavobacterium hungaricum TaxID=2082725 RepID=A0ABR9TP62_9FLAO|nr:hypothetical protein [Flavobacterium hungaricum]MBE8727153.1 hypothetical protein [Flavobacterium hungaricum]